MSVGNLFSSNTNNLTYPGGRYEPSSPVTNDLHGTMSSGSKWNSNPSPFDLMSDSQPPEPPTLPGQVEICSIKKNCPKKFFSQKNVVVGIFLFFWGILFPFASMIKPSWSDSVALSHRIKRLIRLNLSRTKTEFDSEKGFNGCLGLEQAPIYLSLNTFWDWTRALCRSKNFGLFHNFNLFYVLDSYHWKYQTAIQLRCMCSKVRLG